MEQHKAWILVQIGPGRFKDTDGLRHELEVSNSGGEEHRKPRAGDRTEERDMVVVP